VAKILICTYGTGLSLHECMNEWNKTLELAHVICALPYIIQIQKHEIVESLETEMIMCPSAKHTDEHKNFQPLLPKVE